MTPAESVFRVSTRHCKQPNSARQGIKNDADFERRVNEKQQLQRRVGRSGGNVWRVSKTWSHGPHSGIPVLRSRSHSCGNRRQRLPGTAADCRTVTVMFHSGGGSCRRPAPPPPLPLRWWATQWQPTEATMEVLTSKMIVFIWVANGWRGPRCFWRCDCAGLAGNKAAITFSKDFSWTQRAAVTVRFQQRVRESVWRSLVSEQDTAPAGCDVREWLDK